MHKAFFQRKGEINEVVQYNQELHVQNTLLWPNYLFLGYTIRIKYHAKNSMILLHHRSILKLRLPYRVYLLHRNGTFDDFVLSATALVFSSFMFLFNLVTALG